MQGVLAEDEVVVACGCADHVIRCRADGRLELLGHPGPRDADDVLVALAGGTARCRAVEAAWNGIERGAAVQLLDASAEQLARIAHRLPVTLEQREHVRRRDDLSDAQRAALLANFDQAAYLAEVASLGPVLAGRRARAVMEPPWRQRLRRAWTVRTRVKVPAARR